jgi:hypothetical protein
MTDFPCIMRKKAADILSAVFFAAKPAGGRRARLQIHPPAGAGQNMMKAG